jgi:serine/threonine protein kinase/osmotically-inducible protein OsmY
MKRCPECRRVYEERAAFCQIDGSGLDRLDTDPFVGKAITPRCRLIRKLGGGGLGTVYLGEEIATGNRVAVKVLAKELALDDDLLKHCWWDARFATASRPSGIVRVYEVDRTDEGRGYIMMEYLAGESLADVLRREGALEPARALNITRQIAESLAAASKAGVAHGHLKPQDVMLAGPGDRVKVTGFGVARLLELASSGGRAGWNIVSPEYSAPEQQRAGDVSDAADVYSLGAVLYTMLTGAAPVIPSRRGGQATDVEDRPPPIRTLRPHVPVAIEELVDRAMARQPERRVSSLAECVERLRILTDLLISEVALDSARVSVAEARSDAAASRSDMALPALELESGELESGEPESAEPLYLEPEPSRLASWTQALSKRFEASWRSGVERWRSGPTRWMQALARPFGWRPSLVPLRLRAKRWGQGLAMSRRHLVERWQARLTYVKPTLLRVPRLDAPGLRRAAKMAIPGAAALAVAGGTTWAMLDRGVVPTPPAMTPPPAATARIAEPESEVDAAPTPVVGVGRQPEPERQPPRAPAMPPGRAERANGIVTSEPRLTEARPHLPAAQSIEPVPAVELTLTPAPTPPPEPAPSASAAVSTPVPPPTPTPALAPTATPPEPAAVSAQEVSRIRAQAEQTLQSRGLFRQSSADRWGVTIDIASNGAVTLGGALRDMALYAEALRLVREVPGVADVQGNVQVGEIGPVTAAQNDSARLRSEIQEQLRSRGLLRESSADRWGVTVEVDVDGDVRLSGAVRDAELHREAIRRAQDVARGRQVKPDITVVEQGGAQ